MAALPTDDVKARNGPSDFEKVRLDNPASGATDAVRKQEFDAGLSGVSPKGHKHVVSEITDFDGQFPGKLGLHIKDSDNITWFDESGKRVAKVKLRPAGGLKSSSDGLEVDFGPSGTQAAPGNHSHAQLHDALSLEPSLSLNWSLASQKLSGEVRLAPDSGLELGPSGVGVNFAQVARVDHTHGGTHPAATAISSQSLTLSVGADQLISGVVRTDPAPTSGRGKLGVSPAGLYVELGTASNQAAAGNHPHAIATETSDGFMSATDKRKLDQYGTLLALEQSVSFHRTDPLPAGEYVGGRHRWGQAMQILSMHLTALAPTQECSLALEVGGENVETVTIPGGVANAEVSNFRSFTSRHIAKDTYMRVRALSGVGVIYNEPSKVDVSLTLRPSILTAPSVRLNCGGSAVSPFSADAFFTGGGTASTNNAIDRSAVTNPAPEAVYKTARVRYNDFNPIRYIVTNLAKGLPHTIRLHFAEFFFNAIGENVFKISVIGASTLIQNGYDIMAQAGAKFKAVIKEFTVKPDANGTIEVRLDPQPGSLSQFNASINGIELINGTEVVDDPLNLINTILAEVDSKVAKGGDEGDRTMSAQLTTPGVRTKTATIPYSGTLVIDFDGPGVQTCELTGDVMIQTTNRLQDATFPVKEILVRLKGGAAERTVTLHADIIPLKGDGPPYFVAANKWGFLALMSTGPAEADTAAKFAEQA